MCMVLVLSDDMGLRQASGRDGMEEGLEFFGVGHGRGAAGPATTIAAQAEPRSTASRMSPFRSPASSPAMKLSPAPVGLSASTG
jgi:hypothetical protein